MSTTAWRDQQHNLDSLQRMVNAVLIETGKALRSANSKGLSSIGHPNNRIKATLPNALEKFHLALDELEIDILQAQAVLSRDLRHIRQKRDEQDVSATLITKDTIMTDPVDVTTKKEVHREPVSTVQDVGSETKFQDVLVTEPSGLDEADSSVADVLPTTLESDNVKPIGNESGLTPQKQSVDDLATEPPLNDPLAIASVDSSGHREIDNLHESSPSQPGAPVEAGFPSEEFDDLFGLPDTHDTNADFADFDFADGQNAIDFTQSQDLDLSSFGNQDSAFDLLDMSNQASADDVTSRQVTNAPTASAGQGIAMPGGELDTAMGVGNNESNFDDLLEGMDIDFADNPMDSGEFDDAFFTLGDN